MGGQIQPWFNILDFESLKSVMCLALELKEDVCYSFFWAFPSYKQILNCCFVGHSCSKFVSSPVPKSFSWPLVSSLQAREIRSMFMWTASDMGSFWFPFHTRAISEITFTCPFSGISFSVLWTVVQEESLLFQPRSAHVESGASRRQQYPPLLRLGQTWRSAWVLSLAKVKIRQISECIRFAMKNNLASLSFS